MFRQAAPSSHWRTLSCRIACLIVLGATLAGCDKCGDWFSPIRGEVCRDQQEALGQQADEILKQVEQTVGVLERVTPVVQSTDRLQ